MRIAMNQSSKKDELNLLNKVEENILAQSYDLNSDSSEESLGVFYGISIALRAIDEIREQVKGANYND